MTERTTDLVGNATNEFFELHDLNDAAVAYFAAPFIQAKIDEGHMRYNKMLDANKEDVPEGAEALVGEILEMHTITREGYEQVVFELFKGKFRETFILAAIYVPMSQLMKNLLNTTEDENQLALLESAMEDIHDYMEHHIEIILGLCLEAGMPIEMAEEIADEIGDDNVVLEMIEVNPLWDDDEDEDEEECNENGSCNGECGGRCNCEAAVGCQEADRGQCDKCCK